MLKKALGWVVIVAMLVLVVRMVSAQAFKALPSQTRTALPAVVFFHKDSVQANYAGWVDIYGDTVVVFMGIRNGKPTGGIVYGLKSQVDSIILLAPVQTARMKPQRRG